MENNINYDLIRYGFYFCLRNLKRFHQKAASLLSNSGKLRTEGFDIEILKEAARQLSINVEYIGHGAYEFKYGRITRRIKDDLRMDLENAFAFWLCGHKHLTFTLLEKYGIKCLPHYRLYSLNTISDARRDFLNRKKPAVIKPCFGTSGGKGITIDIRNTKDLNRAIFASLMHDRNFLMEDFVEGDHFRILLLKASMLGASKRIPASVIGDGINSLKKLIYLENDRRLKDNNLTALYPINIDNDVRQTIKQNNMTLDHVPDKDQLVYVRSIVNLHAGGEVEDVSKIVNENIVKVCQRVVKIMNISLAGIDIIAKDITKPLSETDGIINEVNTSPSLDVHLKVRNQEDRTDVATEILKSMFKIEKTPRFPTRH